MCILSKWECGNQGLWHFEDICMRPDVVMGYLERLSIFEIYFYRTQVKINALFFVKLKKVFSGKRVHLCFDLANNYTNCWSIRKKDFEPNMKFFSWKLMSCNFFDQIGSNLVQAEGIFFHQNSKGFSLLNAGLNVS